LRKRFRMALAFAKPPAQRRVFGVRSWGLGRDVTVEDVGARLVGLVHEPPKIREPSASRPFSRSPRGVRHTTNPGRTRLRPGVFGRCQSRWITSRGTSGSAATSTGSRSPDLGDAAIRNCDSRSRAVHPRVCRRGSDGRGEICDARGRGNDVRDGLGARVSPRSRPLGALP
jgi:hypothetical protein